MIRKVFHKDRSNHCIPDSLSLPSLAHEDSFWELCRVDVEHESRRHMFQPTFHKLIKHRMSPGTG